VPGSLKRGGSPRSEGVSERQVPQEKKELGGEMRRGPIARKRFEQPKTRRRFEAWEKLATAAKLLKKGVKSQDLRGGGFSGRRRKKPPLSKGQELMGRKRLPKAGKRVITIETAYRGTKNKESKKKGGRSKNSWGGEGTRPSNLKDTKSKTVLGGRGNPQNLGKTPNFLIIERHRLRSSEHAGPKLGDDKGGLRGIGRVYHFLL